MSARLDPWDYDFGGLSLRFTIERSGKTKVLSFEFQRVYVYYDWAWWGYGYGYPYHYGVWGRRYGYYW